MAALTPQQVYEGIREGFGDPPEPIREILIRQYMVAVEMIGAYLKEDMAPDDVHNEAAVRIVAYLYNSSPTGGRNIYPNAMANSGAGGLLDMFRVPRLIPVDGSIADTPGGSGLTPQQLALLAEIPSLQQDITVLNGHVTRIDGLILAIRQVPDHMGHAVGEVLTILNTGGIDWATIGEAQIAAAVAQYLIDNPISGVTAQQLAAEVAKLVALINTNAANISSNDDDIQTNATAIAKNLADLGTERARITANANAIPRLQGQIVISPNNIPSAAAIQRDFKFGWFGLPEAWLKAQGGNEFEVWANGFAFHAVDPWVPTADGVIDVNVNDTEANGINIAAGQTIVSILMVVRKDGNFVAEWETVMEIIELPTTDAPTQDQFNKEVAAREAGDDIQPETINGAARFVSFLADQERSDNVAIAHFTVAVAEDYKGVRHNYKVNDYAWFPPNSVDGKVFANIPPPTEAFEFSIDDKIEMLNLRTDPGVIAYPSGGLTAALTRTVRVLIDNPGRLDEQLWVQGSVDGQAVLNRVAWSTATNSLNFVIPIATARLIGQDEELDLSVQWYDAANAGNLVGTRRVDLPLVKHTAFVELANKAAYDAIAAKDPDTIYLFN